MTMSLNDYLAQEGVLSPFSDFMLDKLRIPHGLTARGWERLQKEAEKARITYAEKRRQAIREYNALLASGEIQAPSKLQRLLATANGHPDNTSTQAARRLLRKRGIDWKTGENLNYYVLNLFEKGRAIRIRKKEANLLFEKMSRFCRENFNISMSLYYAGKTEEDIGSCTLISGPDDKKEYAIEKTWFGQGWVFKSFKNYMEKPDAPCYVAELTDEIYTANDILKLCRNQKSFADQLFGELDRQHPASELDELVASEEWYVCENCGKLVNYMDGEGDLECPFCGTEVVE